MTLYYAVEQLFQIIWLIFLMRILLSWFPNVDWYKQPFKFINDFTEPIFAPFRSIIPSMGGIDLSPIIVFICLGIVRNVILNILGTLAI